MFTIIFFAFNQRTESADTFTYAKCRPSTGERINDSLTLQRAQLYAAFDEVLMELCWMPSATLPGVAGDPREVEHVAGNTATRVRPSVAILLSPGRNADSVGIERRVVAPEPQ